MIPHICRRFPIPTSAYRERACFTLATKCLRHPRPGVTSQTPGTKKPFSTRTERISGSQEGIPRLGRIFAFAAPLAAGVIMYTHLQGPTLLHFGGTEEHRGPDPNVNPESTKEMEASPDPASLRAEFIDASQLPRKKAVFTTAPNVPPPLTRDYPVLLEVPLTTSTKVERLTNQYQYEKWNFNGSVPGPFIRAREGDVAEITLTNNDETGNPHNIDCHAFLAPGGGSALTTAEEGQTKVGRFRLLCPGLYVYHCAAAPVPVHIANGMYGLMYVQPANGDLPPVDHEYYVMQSEFYHEPPDVEEDGRPSSQVEFSYPKGLREEPDLITFNGREGALTTENPLKARVGETVRIYFGNAGPNLTSSFHVIGSNLMKLYRDADVLSPPAQNVQTTSVPPGGATIADMRMMVPGTYTILDHAMFRLDKGAVGYLNVSGATQPQIYDGEEPPSPCVGCKLHP